MLEASAIILAGGRSSRMGTNKALVTVTNCRLIEDIAFSLSQRFAEVIISANESSYDELGFKTVADTFLNCGPLGGIHAGLAAAGYENSFMAACDMPFVDARLAEYLVRSVTGFDAVVPKLGVYYQPLFAVYAKSCLQAIESCLQDGRNKITSFYDSINVRFVGIEEIKVYGDPNRIFFNVNTSADLELARKIAGRERNSG